MTRSNIAALTDGLTERDHELLMSVEKYRLLTTKQIQRLHFDQAHPTPNAAARACGRALTRLRDLGVLKALERRVGGVRAGSAGFVWYVGPAGERLLRHLDPAPKQGRRNYREPSRHFVNHTLAVTELAIQAIEAARAGAIEILELETEPDNWQQSLSPHGTIQWLKPDLRLVTATAEEEWHWFIEVDLATEHLPVIRRQCAAYENFRATGRYQAAHGLFPAVLWVTPTRGPCGRPAGRYGRDMVQGRAGSGPVPGLHGRGVPERRDRSGREGSLTGVPAGQPAVFGLDIRRQESVTVRGRGALRPTGPVAQSTNQTKGGICLHQNNNHNRKPWMQVTR